MASFFWRNAYPSVLGFNNFPKSISTSVNNVACHGLPDERPLENGDIISIDVTVYKNGFHGVCGSTYGGFHLHLLVFPFVYPFNPRIEALVCS